MTASPMTPAAFAAHIRAETATWEKVITARGIRAD
jgi:tripartite-type tricarboxylate transporter receptor subunit TctC